MTVLTETRERFLLAIAAKVAPERIAEIHFFSPIKQGGVESGVAVIAEEREQPAPEPSESLNDEDVAAEDAAPAPPAEDERPNRYVIHTARYRLTLKGPDRGKWETNVVAEADAPLVTVDAVVRGVQRRSGDVDDPTRMEGDEVRGFLDERARAAAASVTRT